MSTRPIAAIANTEPVASPVITKGARSRITVGRSRRADGPRPRARRGRTWTSPDRWPVRSPGGGTVPRRGARPPRSTHRPRRRRPGSTGGTNPWAASRSSDRSTPRRSMSTARARRSQDTTPKAASPKPTSAIATGVTWWSQDASSAVRHHPTPVRTAPAATSPAQRTASVVDQGDRRPMAAPPIMIRWPAAGSRAPGAAASPRRPRGRARPRRAGAVRCDRACATRRAGRPR